MKRGRETGRASARPAIKNIENNPMQSSRATGMTACGFSETI
jgi:hypothetical protein